jgi:uncharacterized radical SAM superfamily Fe-S cluster-containing enzyme
VYSFTKPERVEHCVIFWDTKNGEVSPVMFYNNITDIDRKSGKKNLFILFNIKARLKRPIITGQII